MDFVEVDFGEAIRLARAGQTVYHEGGQPMPDDWLDNRDYYRYEDGNGAAWVFWRKA